MFFLLSPLAFAFGDLLAVLLRRDEKHKFSTLIYEELIKNYISLFQIASFGENSSI